MHNLLLYVTAVTDAPYQFSMKGRYTAVETIDWATCESIYREQFAAGQSSAADGSLTILAQNNFGDLFNEDITVYAVTTEEGLILEEGTGTYVSLVYLLRIWMTHVQII